MAVALNLNNRRWITVNEVVSRLDALATRIFPRIQELPTRSERFSAVFCIQVAGLSISLITAFHASTVAARIFSTWKWPSLLDVFFHLILAFTFVVYCNATRQIMRPDSNVEFFRTLLTNYLAKLPNRTTFLEELSEMSGDTFTKFKEMALEHLMESPHPLTAENTPPFVHEHLEELEQLRLVYQSMLASDHPEELIGDIYRISDSFIWRTQHLGARAIVSAVSCQRLL